MDNSSLSELLKKIYFLHDCNFENITVNYKKYSEDAPDGYIKDNVDITCIINLTNNEDKYFDNKTLSIIFYDVIKYKIENNNLHNSI